MKLSILIASHGALKWNELALERALPSALTQDAHEVLHLHDPAPTQGRASVRNRLAGDATGDWLCFLDADDELDPGFAGAMAAAEQPRSLLTPAVAYVCADGTREPPCFWPVKRDLRNGNWMIVGTLVERDLFLEVGGWRHLDATGVANEYDDWELWIRCTRAGATPVKVPDAVYVAHVAADSPHRSLPHSTRVAWVNEVNELHFR